MKALEAREQEVKRRGLLGSRVAAPGMPPPSAELVQEVSLSAEAAHSEEFAHMDLDGDGVVTAAELAAFTQRVQEQAQAQHQQYIAAISAVNDEAVALEAQILKVFTSPVHPRPALHTHALGFGWPPTPASCGWPPTSASCVPSCLQRLLVRCPPCAGARSDGGGDGATHATAEDEAGCQARTGARGWRRRGRVGVSYRGGRGTGGLRWTHWHRLQSSGWERSTG